MAKYLGLDLSTQSLSALIVDGDTGQILIDESINFGKDLPGYNAPNGFVKGDKEGEVFSSPLMWLDAADKLFSKLQEQTDLSSIRAIAGSGQQHATVYLNSQFKKSLSHLDTAKSLRENLKTALSRELSPIWMDNSTSAECQEIADTVGGSANVLKVSGSIPIERFSGAQIRKFSKESPEAYSTTSDIHLASSFFCSVMSGTNAPIDLGDGAGMNLLNLQNNNWDSSLLDACAPDLGNKLPTAKASNSYVSTINTYFVEKYGFSADTEVYVFSGDNPNSLIGCGGALPGTAVISLGTSDTFFAAMSNPVTDPNGFGHVFGNPAGGYMSLICFMNGSLTREKLKDHYNLDWDQFSAAITNEADHILLPWLIDEITPKANASKESLQALEASSNASDIRKFVEGQFINMQVNSEWMGEEINHIILTGGASQNDALAQLIADVFNAKIERLKVTNSAALGAAMRAYQATTESDWQSVNSIFIKTDEGKSISPQAFRITEKTEAYKALAALNS
ncbi:MAG: FGGY-family carbohydrate kinase [Lentisphaeraceae bacterium]|nr:FGGY-family carbohydrate kinase [Lentisphaeraceae bacterium]